MGGVGFNPGMMMPGMSPPKKSVTKEPSAESVGEKPVSAEVSADGNLQSVRPAPFFALSVPFFALSVPLFAQLVPFRLCGFE